jgi:pyruvate ferredoxin oxidoreductase beta subunit
MPGVKELAKHPELFSGGHRACAGCGGTIIIRQVLQAASTLDIPVVCTSSTGCMEVVSTIFPYTAWRCSFMHSAFENSAATMSGIEAAYRAHVRRKRIDRPINFIAWGGDGGTYDIGLQALSGAVERGHRMLYICYDNQAYMNTGVQRSSATPLGAHTTTSPAGSCIPGKVQWRKDLTEIIAAHDIPYAAQASPSNFRDLSDKVVKALKTDGPSFMNIISSCQLGWQHDPSDTIEILRLAVDSCFWPLYEVENGAHRLTYRPKKKKIPVKDWLERQGRFRHLFDEKCSDIVSQFQHEVDRRWERLLVRCGEDGG